MTTNTWNLDGELCRRDELYASFDEHTQAMCQDLVRKGHAIIIEEAKKAPEPVKEEKKEEPKAEEVKTEEPKVEEAKVEEVKKKTPKKTAKKKKTTPKK